MSSREHIAAVAQAMLDGRVELHAGCREICEQQHQLSMPDVHDKDLLFVVGVDSELAACPVGAARQYWEPTALAEKDRERDEYLCRVNDRLVTACRALATWQ